MLIARRSCKVRSDVKEAERKGGRRGEIPSRKATPSAGHGARGSANDLVHTHTILRSRPRPGHCRRPFSRLLCLRPAISAAVLVSAHVVHQRRVSNCHSCGCSAHRLPSGRYNSYSNGSLPYDGSNGYGYTPSVMTYDIRGSTDFVDSTTFDQQHPLQDPQLPEPPPPVTNELEKEIDMEEDIVSLVSEAHMKTCHLSSAEIARRMEQAQSDMSRQVEMFRSMVSRLASCCKSLYLSLVS